MLMPSNDDENEGKKMKIHFEDLKELINAQALSHEQKSQVLRESVDEVGPELLTYADWHIQKATALRELIPTIYHGLVRFGAKLND